MAFSLEGIEVAFGWKRYEDEYSIVHFEDFHDTYA